MIDIHWLLSWEVVSKFLLIIITAVLGLWNEIREKFSKKVAGKETKKNKIYIYALLFILVLTLFNEMLNTKKSVREATTAQDSLKSQAGREKAMNATLNRTMGKVDSSISNLQSLLKITDSVKKEQKDLLKSSIHENELIHTTARSLRDISHETKKKFPKIGNLINAVNFSMVLEVDSFSYKYPQLFALISSHRRGADLIYLNQDTLIYNDPTFTDFKFLYGNFGLVPYPAKKHLGNIAVNDIKKDDTELEYGILDFADSSTYSLYKKTGIGKLTHSDPFASSPYSIAYHFVFKSNSLLITYGECMTFKIKDKLSFYSPLDFQDKELMGNYYCFFSFLVSGIKNHDLTRMVSAKLNSLSITFNRGYPDQTYELTKLKKVDDNFYIAPLEFKSH
jgi:hypothetical protein